MADIFDEKLMRAALDEADKELRRALNASIKKVTEDVEQTLIIGDEIRLADNFDRELMIEIQKYKEELDNGEIRFDHKFYKKKEKK